MDKIINCSNYALSKIETELKYTKTINENISKKKNGNSKIKRITMSAIYIIGLVASIFVALIDKDKLITSYDIQMCHKTSILAGIFTALFFLILLVRNFFENKYYKTLYINEKKVSAISGYLIGKKGICSSYYGLLDNRECSTNKEIKLGEDVEVTLKRIEEQIISLKKRKTNVRMLLGVVYYFAAFSVGAFLALLSGNIVSTMLVHIMSWFNVIGNDAKNWVDGIYGICAIGVLGGPIFARYYFENIKLTPLADSLIFLIICSGILGFWTCLMAVVVIAMIIKMVMIIIQTLLYIIIIIIVCLIIVAAIVALFSGD